MTSAAMDGRIVTLTEGKNLTDHKGKLIEFNEENGVHIGKGSDSDGSEFTYYLEPIGQPQYTVRIVKKPKGGQENVNESGQPTVGGTFKASDKTKEQFVADYGTANQNKSQASKTAK